MRRALLLLACLVLAPALRAEAEDDDAFVDLTGATVLASPGTPTGLHPFLPGGRAPRPLSWPLPTGPLVVLGLPGTDDAARQLAFFWDLLAPGDDLHGGYLVAAWHDGERPIVVILGDDAAALYAARFELESALPPRGMSLDTVDTTRPPLETGLQIRRGRRLERAVFRQRALYPRRLSPESVLEAIAGRANRLWIDAERDADGIDQLPHLTRHGVVPCVVVRIRAADESDTVAERGARWIRRGVRHLVVRPTGGGVQAEDVERHVEHLRGAFGSQLQEIVVLHPKIRVPGTLGTWLPEASFEPRLTANRARAAVTSAEIPLLFVEGWARANRTPVPSRPRGRPPELGRLFAGVLVLDGPGATGVLEDAWGPRGPAGDEWEAVLLPLLPRHQLAPRAFLEQTAARLAALDVATRHAVGWLDPLLGRLRSDAQDLDERTRCVLVPRAPAAVRLDGALDEPAWAYATGLSFPVPHDPEGRTATLLAVADGHDLSLALRLPAEAPPLALVVSTSALEPEPGCGIGDAARPGGGAMRRNRDVRTWEGTLGHFDLAGDAHPTRTLHLWHLPRDKAPERIGTLVLGP